MSLSVGGALHLDVELFVEFKPLGIADNGSITHSSYKHFVKYK